MMTRKVIFPSQSLMEMAWLYGIVSFAIAGIIGRSLPFATWAGCFYTSVIVGRSVFNRGLRNAVILSLQASGFVCTSLVVLHTFFYPSFPLFDGEWIFRLLARHSPQEWLNPVVVLLSVGGFWAAGIALAVRKMEYRKITGRFDVGLAAFFCLFLLEAGMKAKGGTIITNNASLPCLLLFFASSLPAIAVVRLKEEKGQTRLPGYRLLGIVAGLTGVLFFTGAVAVVLGSGFLRKTADVGYQAIQTGARGLVSIISPILRFLYLPQNVLSEPAGASAKTSGLHPSATPLSWWGKVFYRIMDMGVKGLLLAIVVAIAAFIAYSIVWWLLKRKAVQKQKPHRTHEERPWYRRFLSVLYAIRQGIQRMFKNYDTAVDVYGSLVRWGRLSGIAPLRRQTPREFTKRLVPYFPALQTEINLILLVYSLEVYGGEKTDVEGIAELRTALRRLKHPRHWMARVRVRIRGTLRME